MAMMMTFSKTLLCIFCTMAMATTAMSKAPYNPDSSIAIVGAGMSGLSTAYYLQAKGYTDITIFEKTARAGGLVTTINYNNISHDLGPAIVAESFFSVKSLLADLGIEECPYPFSRYFPSTNTFASTLEVAFAYEQEFKTLPEGANFTEEIGNQIQQYTALWSQLFDEPFLNEELQTNRLFPKQPTEDSIRLLSLPAPTFLKEQGLELMLPIIQVFLDGNAAGPTVTTPALYALSLVHPALFTPTAVGVVPCTSYQDVVDKLVEKLAPVVNLHFGMAVERVERGRHGATVVMQSGNSQRFDAVVMTGQLPTKGSMNAPATFTPVSRKEKQLLRSIEELELYLSLLEGDREDFVAPDIFQLFDAEPIVFPQTPIPNFWGLLNMEAAGRSTPTDLKKIQTIGLLSFYEARAAGKAAPPQMEAQKELLESMHEYTGTEWNELVAVAWSGYFQRFQPEGVAKGFPWELNNGNGNVYFVGTVVCGVESVGHMVECARNLVEDHF